MLKPFETNNGAVRHAFTAHVTLNPAVSEIAVTIVAPTVHALGELSARRRFFGEERLLDSTTTLCLPALVRAYFREIGDGCKFSQELRQQRETIVAHRFVISHYHDFLKEAIDGLAQAGDAVEGLLVVPRPFLGLHFHGGFAAGGEEFSLGIVLEEFRIHGDALLEVGLFNDLSDAFEGNGEWLEVLGFADDA